MSFVVETEAHDAQASPTGRDRPAKLSDRERLYIYEHCPFPGSVRPTYTSRKAHLTFLGTVRHVKTSYCKILNLLSTRMLRIDCGMLMARLIVDFART